MRRSDGEPPVPARCGWTRSVPTVQEVIDYHGTNGTRWTRSVPAVQEGRFLPRYQRYTVDTLRTNGTGGDRLSTRQCVSTTRERNASRDRKPPQDDWESRNGSRGGAAGAGHTAYDSVYPGSNPGPGVLIASQEAREPALMHGGKPHSERFQGSGAQIDHAVHTPVSHRTIPRPSASLDRPRSETASLPTRCTSNAMGP